MSATQKYVDDFAKAMEAKLEVNRHKGDREGWLGDSMNQLLGRCMEEFCELSNAVLDKKSPQEVRDEAADVANFCMMIADKYNYELNTPRT